MSPPLLTVRMPFNLALKAIHRHGDYSHVSIREILASSENLNMLVEKPMSGPRINGYVSVGNLIEQNA